MKENRCNSSINITILMQEPKLQNRWVFFEISGFTFQIQHSRRHSPLLLYLLSWEAGLSFSHSWILREILVCLMVFDIVWLAQNQKIYSFYFEVLGNSAFLHRNHLHQILLTVWDSSCFYWCNSWNSHWVTISFSFASNSERIRWDHKSNQFSFMFLVSSKTFAQLGFLFYSNQLNEIIL